MRPVRFCPFPACSPPYGRLSQADETIRPLDFALVCIYDKTYYARANHLFVSIAKVKK
jgi:hypothetical protein